MFNRTNVHAPTTYGGPSHVHVEEKRAPTDDSMRLLEEMREKVQASVVAAYTVDNVVKGSIVVLRSHRGHHDFLVVVTFSLNGREFQEEQHVDDVTLLQKPEEQRKLLRAAVRDAIGQALTVEVQV